jgi:phosphatidylglycerophosphate synthase
MDSYPPAPRKGPGLGEAVPKLRHRRTRLAGVFLFSVAFIMFLVVLFVQGHANPCSIFCFILMRPLLVQLLHSVAHEPRGQHLLFHSLGSLPSRSFVFIHSFSFNLSVHLEFGPDINVGLLTHLFLILTLYVRACWTTSQRAYGSHPQARDKFPDRLIYI